MEEAQGQGLDRANRDLVERFFAASERGDLAALGTLVDDQMVMDWPQSGEVFRGRENVLAAMGAVEVKPEFAGQPQLVGSGHIWVLMVPLRYGAEILHYVAVLEVHEGRIHRGTGYWGARSRHRRRGRGSRHGSEVGGCGRTSARPAASASGGLRRFPGTFGTREARPPRPAPGRR